MIHLICAKRVHFSALTDHNNNYALILGQSAMGEFCMGNKIKLETKYSIQMACCAAHH